MPIGKHSETDGAVMVNQRSRYIEAASIVIGLQIFDDISFKFINKLSSQFYNFKDYLFYVYKSTDYKLPNNITAYVDSNHNGVVDKNDKEVDGLLEKGDIVTNVESYDFSLYGITNTTEYREISIPDIE